MRRDGTQPKDTGVSGDDVERLCADGAGAAEDSNIDHEIAPSNNLTDCNKNKIIVYGRNRKQKAVHSVQYAAMTREKSS